MDEKAIYAAGLDKGESRGIEIGMKEGEKKNKIEVAKRMKAKCMDIDTIIEITELNKGRN